MSRYTICNFCRFRQLKQRAIARGAKVVEQGPEVYVVPKGEKLNKEKHFVAWFMERQDYCECSY